MSIYSLIIFCIPKIFVLMCYTNFICAKQLITQIIERKYDRQKADNPSNDTG